ncbi:hypothetical protein CCR82_05185 [Halochromatium salexigens]|uniref:Uncharacterized protein n=2 Tax=Halochromatium salexigens TaxID=49447 RepID=A0AAJ0UEF4_HALSE|nr:hypothetical protein [Halochromatium salexigens]
MANDLKRDLPCHIISSEYLFRCSDAEKVSNVIEFLSDYVDEIEVYAFVRSPAPYYNSRQQQVIKASHHIIHPNAFRYDFKAVIEAWSTQAKVNVIGYDKGVDSLSRLAEAMGVDIRGFKLPQKQNESLAIEQMLLLEKIQRNLYQEQDNIFKNHLGLVGQIKSQQATKPTLKPGVAEIIEKTHEQDLAWLKTNYAVDFLGQSNSNAKKGKNRTAAAGLRIPRQPSIRDVYIVDEEKAALYESMVLDLLMKKFVELKKA